MYEYMTKVPITLKNAVEILADLDKILILQENHVFARGKLIF